MVDAGGAVDGDGDGGCDDNGDGDLCCWQIAMLIKLEAHTTISGIFGPMEVMLYLPGPLEAPKASVAHAIQLQRGSG